MKVPTPDQARETIVAAEQLLALGRDLEAAVTHAHDQVISEHAALVAPKVPQTAQVDFSRPVAAQQPLAVALDRWQALADTRRQLRRLFDRVLPALATDLPHLDLLTSGVRRVFTGGDRKASTLQAWVRVSQVMDWAEARTIRTRIEQALNAPGLEMDAAARQKALIETVGLRLDHAAISTDTTAIDTQLFDDSALGLPLREYQKYGVKAALYHRRLLLTDEPGLGGSVQALGLLRSLGRGHHLVVASALQQSAWARSVAEHTRLPVFRLDDAHASALWAEIGGVAIATHDSTPREHPPLGALVVDDAHYLRERSGRRATAVAELADRSDYVLLLTSDPNFKVAGTSIRRVAEDVPYELPKQTLTFTWLDPTAEDLAAFETAVLAGNFSQMRRAGFATGEVAESAKLARVIEVANAARKNGRKCVIASHFLRVLATSEHALSQLGFATLGPLTESTPPEHGAALLEEFTSADQPVVLVTQLFDDGLRLPDQVSELIHTTVVTEPPTAPVKVPGRVVYTLALVGTADDGMVALAADRLPPTALGRRLVSANRRF